MNKPLINSTNKIPEQLRNKDFRFVKLGEWDNWRYKKTLTYKKFYPQNLEDIEKLKKDGWNAQAKAPFDPKWQTIDNHEYDSNELRSHLNSQKNYGVIAGFGNLRIIDCDTKEFTDTMEKLLPKTFNVKTGSGCRHYYIISDYDESFNFAQNKGEYRAKKQQVVGPNCKYPLGNYYEIHTDAPIAEVDGDELKKILTPFRAGGKKNNNSTSERDDSRSGVEMSAIISMLFKGYDKKIIFKRMNAYSRWNQDGEAYKEHTYMKAYEFYKTKVKTNNDALELLANKDARGATEVVTNHLLDNYSVCTVKDEFKPEIWCYDEGIWKHEGRVLIKRVCQQLFGKALTTHLINEVIAKVEAQTYVDFDTFFKSSNPELLPLQNGVLNIKTKELLDYSPQLKFFNKIPVVFDKIKKPEKVLEFLSQIVNNEDLLVLQELLGYCLLKDHPYHRVFILFGGGRNGKGRFLELIKRFLGEENTTGLTLSQIEKDDFAKADLHQKMVNLGGDMSNLSMVNTGEIKALSGQDLVSANRKFRPKIKFVNYAKLIFALNELPPTKDGSLGFFSRIIMINFPYVFLDQKNIDELSEEEKAKARLAKPNIIEEITTEGELSGLLNWALQGFERLRLNKDFSYTSTIKAIEEEWVKKSDSIKYFVENYIVDDETDDEVLVTKKAFKNEYLRWCKQERVRPCTDRRIKQVMEDRGYFDKKSSNGPRVWEGAKFQEFQEFHPNPTNRDFSKFSIGSNRVEKVEKLENEV